MLDLRYPIGQFTPPPVASLQQLNSWIDSIESLPDRLRQVVTDLPDQLLDMPYRPGGWTVRQVVHHLPDSHLNSYIRFKWALTEDNPVIKAYDEVAWAELPEAKEAPVEVSLKLLESLHARWVLVLKELTPEQLARTFTHPATGTVLRLDQNIGVYAWHGEHHLAHITALLQRLG